MRGQRSCTQWFFQVGQDVPCRFVRLDNVLVVNALRLCVDNWCRVIECVETCALLNRSLFGIALLACMCTMCVE